MSSALITACFWVLAATATATLPMRYQRVCGLALLLAAPVLLIWIGMAHGPLVLLACSLAVISTFRHPLRAMARRVWGLTRHQTS